MADAKDTLDDRIALIRRNIADLTEQATAASGAATEERLAARLNDLQDKLGELLKEREGLAGRES
ncbi:hypothetical protein [Bosea sp. (in: a-proteobacteria)]|uniref:hypothetical protein n=1 Tax=Bosea sp. (in: a-proteobacteria) TaxID=1871050 RepID=UPI002FCA95A3